MAVQAQNYKKLTGKGNGEPKEYVLVEKKDLDDFINKIVSGETVVGNSKKLDGHTSNYFAKQNELDDIVDGTTPVAKADDATTFNGHTDAYFAKQNDLDNIVKGTTAVGNSTKLGGKVASDYLFKSSSDTVDFYGCKIGNLNAAVLRNVDVNAYTNSGFYYISDGCSNVPRNYIAIFSSISQGTAGGQVGVSRETNDLYVRNIKNGVFGAWRSIGVTSTT